MPPIKSIFKFLGIFKLVKSSPFIVNINDNSTLNSSAALMNDLINIKLFLWEDSLVG